MNSLGRLILIFLVVFFIVIKPLQYTSDIQNTNNIERAEQITKQLIHDICYNQELSVAMYEMYLQKLQKTGNAYQIKLSIGHTVKEVTSIEHKIQRYSLRNTSILKANQNVLNLFSIGGHIHNENCYFGTKHEHEGNATTGEGCYSKANYEYHVHAGSAGSLANGCYTKKVSKSYYCDGCTTASHNSSTIQLSLNEYTCSEGAAHAEVKWSCTICRNTITIIAGASCHSSTGGTLHTTTTYTCNGHSSTTYELGCDKTTSTVENVTYSLNCGKEEGIFFNGVEETYDPKCDQVVVSMKPLYQNQMTELGDEINLQGIATFLDGHEQVINCTSNYKSVFGKQEVTLTYEGLLYTAKNKGRLTVKTNVTTISYVTCPECGARYESDEAGLDKGCPFEKNTLLDIKVIPRKTMYELGEELKIDVIGIYKNEETIIHNWTSNYDAYAKGKQTILVQYKSFTKEIEITIRTNTEVACKDCGTIYDKENFVCANCSQEILCIQAYIETNEIEFGEDLPVYLIVTYKDGYQEYYEDGFEIIGYDKFKLGIQEITIRYEGYEDHIQIHNIQLNTTLLICENGHTYLSNKDGSNSGCPSCSADSEQKEDYNYVEITYHEEMIEKLYENTILKFESGDLISIEVTYPKSSFEKLKDTIFFRGTSDSKKRFVYGGEVN